MISEMSGGYLLADDGGGTKVTYELAVGLQGADDRDAEAPGREDHHGYGAQGPQDTGRRAWQAEDA